MTREEAKAYIIQHCNPDYPNGNTEWEIAMNMAIEALQQPEIIRCKNCKYWREHKYAKETKRYIPFCGFNAIYTKSDDFCSRAVMKGE